MKTIEIIKNLASPVLIGGLGGLLSLGISVSAWGDGCDQNPPGASTVMRTSGSQSCLDVSGQSGCTVELNGTKSGGCIVEDDVGNSLFYVVVSFNNKSGLEWRKLQDPNSSSALVNTVLVVSEGVDTCNYIYPNEADSGSGQGWSIPSGVSDSKTFADVQTVSFCTDGEANDTPPPDCGTGGYKLFGQTIDCNKVEPAGQGAVFLGLTLDQENSETGENEALDSALDACSCNMQLRPLKLCDENALAGDANQCMGVNALEALPLHIEIGHDRTWICRTIGGERKCWNR